MKISLSLNTNVANSFGTYDKKFDEHF